MDDKKKKRKMESNIQCFECLEELVHHQVFLTDKEKKETKAIPYSVKKSEVL